MKKEQKNMKQKGVKRTIMYYIKQEIRMYYNKTEEPFHCYKAKKMVRVLYRNNETKWLLSYFQFQM